MQDNIRIVTLRSANYQDYIQDLEYFCRSAESDSSPAAQNYHWTGWERNTASIMWALVQEQRYDVGGLDLLYVNDEPTAISGYYPADWDPRVLVVGSRVYTVPNHRGDWWHGQYLFPRQADYARRAGYRAMVMTFNEYNHRLLRFIQRMTQGHAVVLGQAIPDFYRDFRVLPGRYIVKHTPQRLAVAMINGALPAEFERMAPPQER